MVISIGDWAFRWLTIADGCLSECFGTSAFVEISQSFGLRFFLEFHVNGADIFQFCMGPSYPGAPFMFSNLPSPCFDVTVSALAALHRCGQPGLP